MSVLNQKDYCSKSESSFSSSDENENLSACIDIESKSLSLLSPFGFSKNEQIISKNGDSLTPLDGDFHNMSICELDSEPCEVQVNVNPDNETVLNLMHATFIPDEKLRCTFFSNGERISLRPDCSSSFQIVRKSEVLSNLSFELLDDNRNAVKDSAEEIVIDSDMDEVISVSDSLRSSRSSIVEYLCCLENPASPSIEGDNNLENLSRLVDLTESGNEDLKKDEDAVKHSQDVQIELNTNTNCNDENQISLVTDIIGPDQVGHCYQASRMIKCPSVQQDDQAPNNWNDLVQLNVVRDIWNNSLFDYVMTNQSFQDDVALEVMNISQVDSEILASDLPNHCEEDQEKSVQDMNCSLLEYAMNSSIQDKDSSDVLNRCQGNQGDGLLVSDMLNRCQDDQVKQSGDGYIFHQSMNNNSPLNNMLPIWMNRGKRYRVNPATDRLKLSQEDQVNLPSEIVNCILEDQADLTSDIVTLGEEDQTKPVRINIFDIMMNVGPLTNNLLDTINHGREDNVDRTTVWLTLSQLDQVTPETVEVDCREKDKVDQVPDSVNRSQVIQDDIVPNTIKQDDQGVIVSHVINGIDEDHVEAMNSSELNPHIRNPGLINHCQMVQDSPGPVNVAPGFIQGVQKNDEDKQVQAMRNCSQVNLDLASDIVNRSLGDQDRLDDSCMMIDSDVDQDVVASLLSCSSHEDEVKLEQDMSINTQKDDVELAPHNMIINRVELSSIKVNHIHELQNDKPLGTINSSQDYPDLIELDSTTNSQDDDEQLFILTSVWPEAGNTLSASNSQESLMDSDDQSHKSNDGKNQQRNNNNLWSGDYFKLSVASLKASPVKVSATPVKAIRSGSVTKLKSVGDDRSLKCVGFLKEELAGSLLNETIHPTTKQICSTKASSGPVAASKSSDCKPYSSSLKAPRAKTGTCSSTVKASSFTQPFSSAKMELKITNPGNILSVGESVGGGSFKEELSGPTTKQFCSTKAFQIVNKQPPPVAIVASSGKASTDAFSVRSSAGKVSMVAGINTTCAAVRELTSMTGSRSSSANVSAINSPSSSVEMSTSVTNSTSTAVKMTMSSSNGTSTGVKVSPMSSTGIASSALKVSMAAQIFTTNSKSSAGKVSTVTITTESKSAAGNVVVTSAADNTSLAVKVSPAVTTTKSSVVKVPTAATLSASSAVKLSTVTIATDSKSSASKVLITSSVNNTSSAVKLSTSVTTPSAAVVVSKPPTSSSLAGNVSAASATNGTRPNSSRNSSQGSYNPQINYLEPDSVSDLMVCRNLCLDKLSSPSNRYCSNTIL